MVKLIIAMLLLTMLSLSGCLSATKREIKTPQKKDPSGYIIRHEYQHVGGRDVELATDIVHLLKTTSTPQEWEAVKLLGGRTLDSVTIDNECRHCDPNSRTNMGGKLIFINNTLRRVIELVFRNIPESSTNCLIPISLSAELSYLDDDERSSGAIFFDILLRFPTLLFTWGLISPIYDQPKSVSMKLDSKTRFGNSSHVEAVGSCSVYGIDSLWTEKYLRKGLACSIAEALKVAAVKFASSHNCLTE